MDLPDSDLIEQRLPWEKVDTVGICVAVLPCCDRVQVESITVIYTPTDCDDMDMGYTEAAWLYRAPAACITLCEAYVTSFWL